jgi:NAD(P)-dependent dehydrogenase (short-subunit alcohol dehydrogenase family)
VALLGRDEGRLGETLALLPEQGRHACFRHDYLAQGNSGVTATAVIRKVGKIAGIVHCAGVSTTLPLRVVTEDKLGTLSRVNVFGPLLLTRALTNPSVLCPDGASVVFVASVMGVVGEVGKSLYSLTKGALIAAARSLALELAPKKIRVNCVSPGVVVTPMSKGSVYGQTEEAWERVRSLHPLGLGTPEDVANTCLFLLCDEARWITGANFVVDGGYTAR